MGENVNKNKRLVWTSADGAYHFVRQLLVEELDSVYAINQAQLNASVAPIEVAKAVLEYNSDAFWGVYNATDAEGSGAALVGYSAFLMLNEDGADALRQDRFDPFHPSIAHLASTGERPALVYMWAVVARGLGAMAIPITTNAMGSLYAGLPLYGTAATEAGAHAMRSFGMKPAHEGKDGVGCLYWLDRSHALKAEEELPTNLTPRTKVVIATTSDEIEKVWAIRATVFMGEQHCPYGEEFDGNDRTATHVLGHVDGEPAGTMRIRYFSDFVKIERLAVLRRYRGTHIASEIVETGLEFCRRKGFRKMYGHAQVRLLPFWARFGFAPIGSAPAFAFSDHEYIEVEGELPAHADPITAKSGPNLFLRPEGQWNVPGILELSAARRPTNPNRDRA
jgi:predicted GNAT family N-acyltransferase